MKKELQQDYNEGLMIKKYWSKEHWTLMEKIRSDSEAYFEENHIDYLNRYLYKEYIVNNDLPNI